MTISRTWSWRTSRNGSTLEFKATFDHKKPDAKLEFLRDVVSMANGGGGYLVFGVRDDGHGRAQCFADPDLMANSDSMIKSMRALCHDHIAERIEGIEIRARHVQGNTVILVRIPVSGRRPHMVTLGRRTDFFTRVEDGKRQMSVGEIREAFVKDPIGMRLDSIDARLSRLARDVTHGQRKQDLVEAAQQYHSDHLSRSDDGDALAEVRREGFEQEVGDSPFLWLGCTPANPVRVSSTWMRRRSSQCWPTRQGLGTMVGVWLVCIAAASRLSPELS